MHCKARQGAVQDAAKRWWLHCKSDLVAMLSMLKNALGSVVAYHSWTAQCVISIYQFINFSCKLYILYISIAHCVLLLCAICIFQSISLQIVAHDPWPALHSDADGVGSLGLPALFSIDEIFPVSSTRTNLNVKPLIYWVPDVHCTF